jgi:hypothetical protein
VLVRVHPDHNHAGSFLPGGSDHSRTQPEDMPQVWLAHSVLAGHRPPSAWLDRGVKRLLELRLPAAVPTVGTCRKEVHVITIGTDPDKLSHTAVALDERGQVLGELRVAANKTTVATLQRWARHWPKRTWAI